MWSTALQQTVIVMTTTTSNHHCDYFRFEKEIIIIHTEYKHGLQKFLQFVWYTPAATRLRRLQSVNHAVAMNTNS